MDKVEIPGKHACSACKSRVNEVFEIKQKGGGGGRYGGSHPFHVVAESRGHVCSKCRLRFDFKMTTNEDRLEAIAFMVLAKDEKRKLKKAHGRLLKGQVVYLVPKLSGIVSSMIRYASKDEMVSVVLKPNIKAQKFGVPLGLLKMA